MNPVPLAIVFPMGMFAAVVLIGIVVTMLAPRVIATGVYGGVAAWLVLSAVTAFVFGTPIDLVVVLIQMLLWLLPGAILAARGLFEPADVGPRDHVMDDPRWIVKTAEFLGRLLDEPAPPRHQQSEHGQRPPTQPPGHDRADYEERLDDEDRQERRGPLDVMGDDLQAFVNALRRR